MLATKFFEHFIYVGAAMKKMGGRNYQLWDEQDGFFYDVLRLPNGDFNKFRLRSMVGLIPLYAVEVIEREDLDPHPEFLGNVEWFIRNRPDLVGNACYSVDGQRYVLSIADSEPVCARSAVRLGPGRIPCLRTGFAASRNITSSIRSALEENVLGTSRENRPCESRAGIPTGAGPCGFPRVTC